VIISKYFLRKYKHIVRWFDKHRFSILGISILLFFMGPTSWKGIISPWISQAMYLSVIVLASVNLMQSIRKKIFFYVLALFAFVILWVVKFFSQETVLYTIFLFGSFILFFAVIAHHLFRQMRRIKKMDESMVVASITGYLLLGTLAFLVFCVVELIFPGSFTNTQEVLREHKDIENLIGMTKYSDHVISDLFYFSFISMSTIGYGDIYPIGEVAKRIAVLVGIMGPFYISIVVATIVGKFMAVNSSD
jgi:voltage-gated potassium channel